MVNTCENEIQPITQHEIKTVKITAEIIDSQIKEIDYSLQKCEKVLKEIKRSIKTLSNFRLFMLEQL